MGLFEDVSTVIKQGLQARTVALPGDGVLIRFDPNIIGWVEVREVAMSEQTIALEDCDLVVYGNLDQVREVIPLLPIPPNFISGNKIIG